MEAATFLDFFLERDTSEMRKRQAAIRATAVAPE